ncbi:MAG: cytochrome c biogenesis protein CcsA [Syntrophobacterales bacterium]|jgi:cytochrome c-type biogenesis protein CcmF
MTNLGEITIWLGLIAIGISSGCYWVLNSKEDDIWAWNVARYSFTGFVAFVTLASILLMFAILKHEFIYSYVASYSSRDLPLQYLISSFWAGQEGSFLLWVLLGAWLGIFLMHKSGEMEPQVMFIYNLNHLFLTILLIKQSPFKLLDAVPPDGQGLNMLLQDPWMVIHPPVVFLGYAAFTIPFAYAVAALWRREYDAWTQPALPWTVFAFLSLGAGIIIGGFWSYKVLGWGGYWGWDPVENASLLPWLAGTALMHGMILQQSRRKLRKTNFVLAAFSFLLIIYCTFLTRSGILADFSVHSFQDLGITGWLVFFIFVFIALFLWFFLTRVREIPISDKGAEFSYFSREFGFIGAMIILCLSAVITGVGTSAPLITRVLEKASKVSNEFYVDTNMPLALMMVLLLSFVPLLAWGKNDFAKLSRKMLWAVVGAIVSGALTLYHGYPGIAVLVLAVFAGATVGMNLHLAITLIRKKFTMSSGAIAHLGVGLMFVGIIASSVYDRSEKVLLPQGKMEPALGYDMEFSGPKFMREPRGVRLDLPVDVKKGNTEFIARPDIRSESTPDGQSRRFSRPHIRRGLVSDLYIAPVDFQPASEGGRSANREQLEIKKQQKIQFQDYEITFVGFDISGMMTQKEGQGVSVGADILVSYKGEDPLPLKPVLTMGKEGNTARRVKLPGPAEAYLSLSRIEASSGSIILDYQGPASAGQEKIAQPTPPAFIAEVSTKPGMTVLWLGTFLILFGAGVGVARRWPQ